MRQAATGTLDLATNLATIAFPDGRTVWDELCARHGLSANAARMLRLVGRDSLVEFAAWASTEEEFFVRCTALAAGVLLARRPELAGVPQGSSGERPPGSAGDVAPGPRPWHIDWLGEDTRGRAYAHDPLWGLASLPASITVHYVRVRWRRVCGFLYEFG